MCGIVGFVNNLKDKQEQIKKMADAIVHRGPDGEGYFTDDFVALGHRRLSIIDLSTGNQPMFNENKKVVTVFNGEIYNYKDLKEELVSLGHKFKTKSDTEVLVHGYEEWKCDLPKHLRGMFAFAIYDIENEEVFLARDNFGIKPLYYAYMNETFMFSSEIKSLLENKSFTKIFNEDILKTYLEFSFVPTNETFFKGVHRLDAGHSLLFKNNKINISQYYKLEFTESATDYEKVVKDIECVMENSVENHLISDVEVGSFLSSGIDSSYIVSLAKPDKTYTVGYENPKYNEISLAKDLADKLKIKNKSKIITKEEYMEVIPKIMYHLEEPTSDPATVALYFVAQLASKDLKVVLSGEGADEFFGGYNYYRQYVDMSFYNKIPFIIRNIIAKVCKKLPEVRGLNFLIRRGEKLEDSYIGVNRNYSSIAANKVLKNKYNLSATDVTKEVYKNYVKESDIVKMQAIDIHFWLMKDILLKADRMTMAASLEGRVPFIDKEVFKVASTIPIDFKVTKENTKVALRDASKKVIPNESFKKKKLGFPVPVRQWIKEDDFYNEIYNTFTGDSAKKYFKTKKIISMLNKHKNNKKDYYKKIWTIYCFLKWYNVYFEN